MFSESYNKRIICDDGFENITVKEHKVGFKFFIRFPSYRGTQLSCINEFWVKINDNLVDAKNVLICLNNKQFLLSQLSELYDEYWFILDDAEVRVMREDGLTAGEHELEVCIGYKIPYTGYFGNYVNVVSSFKKTLKLKDQF